MVIHMQKSHGLSLWKMLIIPLTVQGSLKDISILVTLLGLLPLHSLHNARDVCETIGQLLTEWLLSPGDTKSVAA